ncbi:sigma-70 family RNA polymerase sigma factor [Alicyclobacillus dauci]|uniref:Sigma-70 family RNA polymerase sigma factor n=1 Tax=Alicyclobacillus dauci TaxID=1475485 RepID=A0ABY6Z4B6_9BACL|nr:sigma-70 family RNA polymerase sigma factor [Alicyclobacillus dauci]WAH37161.1 sigma-70 family RNA polymerase sigma factor [Alicyclobacillus dauci]
MNASLQETDTAGCTRLTQIAISAKTDDDAFRQLVQELYPIIKGLVKNMSYSKVYDTQDEFVQIMTIELWNAVEDFSPDRNVAFEWFVKDYLYKRSRSVLRSKFYTRRSTFNLKSIRIAENPTDDDDNHVAFPTDKNSLLYKLWERRVRSTVFNKCIKSLTKLEGEVLYLWYVGCSYKEIEERLNINYKSIDNTMMRVKKKLRADDELSELFAFWRDLSAT